MWQPKPTEEYQKGHKWYEKKRPRELKAVLTNLEKYLVALRQGAKPKQIQAGWIHPEPMDIVALDQKGGNGGKLQQTRLYVFPELEPEILHIIAIGGKDTQSDDIDFAKRYVSNLSKPD